MPCTVADVASVPLWHAVQTHPQAERWAAANLERQGYATYLPLCVVQRPDRVLRSMPRTLEVPLWPGYLLVQFSHRDPWGPVQHTRGVARLLMMGGKPAPVAAGLVEALQASEAVRRTLTPPGDAWRPGAPCRLASGAFSGHDAVVISVSTRWAVVALPVLGAVREVTISVDCLTGR